MSRCATASGMHAAEDAAVEEQHRAGDRRHAAGHDGEQLAARHARQVRPHEERRLDHADEHVGRRRQPDHPAHAHRLLQHARQRAHDRRQHAPVEEQRRERAHHQHDRQRAEREDEVRRRVGHRERRRCRRRGSRTPGWCPPASPSRAAAARRSASGTRPLTSGIFRTDEREEQAAEPAPPPPRATESRGGSRSAARRCASSPAIPASAWRESATRGV